MKVPIFQVISVYFGILAASPLFASFAPAPEVPYIQIWDPQSEQGIEIHREITLKKEWPLFQPSKKQIPDLFGENTFCFSLKLASISLQESGKPFILFSPTAKFPLVVLQPIELEPSVLAKKPILQSDTYPDFTPFGQWWLKDPLGNFLYFRQQLTTSSMIKAKEWSVEDSILGLFLSSSIARLEKDLDNFVFDTGRQLSLEEKRFVLGTCFENVLILPSSFTLKEGIDFIEVMKFADIPFLAALVNREEDRMMAKACYENKLLPISLPFNFEPALFLEPRIGQSVQILENRIAASLFLTSEDEFSYSSNSFDLLEDLLKSRENEEIAFDLKALKGFSPLFQCVKYQPFGQPLTYKLKPESANVFLSHLSPVSLNFEKTRILQLPSSFQRSEFICDYEDPPILNVSYDPEAYHFLSLEQPSSTNYPTFYLGEEKGYALRDSRDDLIFDYSITLAKVYDEFFFSHVTDHAKKGKTSLLSLEMSAPVAINALPLEQKAPSFIVMNKGLELPLDVAIVYDQGLLYHPAKILVAQKISPIPSSFGKTSSPLYQSEFLPRNTPPKTLAAITSIVLVKDEHLQLRPPFEEMATEPLFYDAKVDFNLAVQSQDRSYPSRLDCADLGNTVSIFVTLEENISHCPEDIPFFTPSIPLSRMPLFKAKLASGPTKIALSEYSDLYNPFIEKKQFEVDPFDRTIFTQTALQVASKNPSSLAIYEPMKKDLYDQLIKRMDALALASKELIHRISPLDSSFGEVFVCSTVLLNELSYSDFIRHAGFDQKGALLSQPLMIDDSVPQSYYLLPLLDLTETPLLALSECEPDLIDARPLSRSRAMTEMAMRSNQENRLTQMNLAAIPSLEFLKTDSLGNEFDVVVRTIPKKSGYGHYFSILLSPHEQGVIDPIKNHVYFLIDRSITVEPHRYFTFIKGVLQAIDYLQEGTSFNIAFFDHETEWFEKEDLTFKKSTSSHVRKKLKELPQRGKSNIQTFCKLIGRLKLKAENSGEPHTVILLSDGRFMKNIRINRYPIRELVEDLPDNFSLHTVSTSDNNNIAMLNTLAGLCHGDSVYAKTHSAFGRKLSALTKRIHRPIGFSAKVTQVDENDSTILYDADLAATQLYTDKVFKIYGETKEKKEFTLLIQAYNGDRWLNIPKKISFQESINSPSRLSHDIAQYQALFDISHYLKTGDLDALNHAKDLLVSHNLPSPVR